MNLAVVDILDRDGLVRQTVPVTAWPLTVGRALDNSLVLTDPHVAAHHLSIESGADGGQELVVADTVNGVRHGPRQLPGGTRERLPAAGAAAVELTLGRTRLRLHRPGDASAPELPLAPTGSFGRRVGPAVAAAVALLALQLYTTWLGTDPEGAGRAAALSVLTLATGAVAWCGVWALLSKTFTRQAHLGWHVRVFLFGSVALLVAGAVPPVLAFAFSWPWLTDFAFIVTFAIGGVAVYFHLLAVEPARKRLLRGMVAAGVLTGVGLTLWLNRTRTDLFGDELYMSHLLPPAMRLAKPVPADRFVDRLTALKPRLDRKAGEADSGGDAGPAAAESED